MSTPGYSSLRFEVADGIARVRLNRPDDLNTMDLTLCREMRDVAIRCAEDPDVRVVLLSAAGAAFSSGADLRVFRENADTLPAYISEMATEFHIAVSRFARMDAPVIAVVQGVAAGGGMSLVLSADLVLAADSAWFTMAYSSVALTPDGSSSYFLPRLVGFRRAMELMVTNRVLDATEAMEWGMVNEVVPAAELDKRADALAADIAAGPARCYAGIKKLLHTGWNETLESQMAREVRVIAGVAGTEDTREGIAAFLDKREPRFSSGEFCGD